MSQEFEDPRKELLEDLLQWLEWQASCGGEVWPVDNIAIWNQRLPKEHRPKNASHRGGSRDVRPAFLTSKQKGGKQKGDDSARSKKGALSSSQMHLKSNSNTEETVRPDTARTPKKPKRALAAAFTSFLQTRPPSIDFSLLDEKTGLKTIKEHQRRYCSTDPICSIGGGRPGNPVLVIEGHSMGLTQQSKESLGKIMDNVLNIPRNKMYWLPHLHGRTTCNVCPTLFKASLECLSPQIVLIMGGDMRQKVSMRNASGHVQMGIEMEIHTNKWTVPALWTHHPTDMVGDVRLKKECMIHLKTFKRMLRKVTL